MGLGAPVRASCTPQHRSPTSSSGSGNRGARSRGEPGCAGGDARGWGCCSRAGRGSRHGARLAHAADTGSTGSSHLAPGRGGLGEGRRSRTQTARRGVAACGVCWGMEHPGVWSTPVYGVCWGDRVSWGMEHPGVWGVLGDGAPQYMGCPGGQSMKRDRAPSVWGVLGDRASWGGRASQWLGCPRAWRVPGDGASQGRASWGMEGPGGRSIPGDGASLGTEIMQDRAPWCGGVPGDGAPQGTEHPMARGAPPP